MKFALAERVGIDFPIFGFSHCRDVVIALGKAGCIGVLGTTRLSPEHLDRELMLIENALDGRPYGVDLIFPANSAGDDEAALAATIPPDRTAFVHELIDRFQIPAPTGKVRLTDDVENRVVTHKRARERLEVALDHSVRLYASALGPPPRDVIDRMHAKGALVAGMVGDAKHCTSHLALGVDILIAIGLEAGGHTGRIATTVLVPQVVDRASPTPVLAGGGIGSGRQLAAAFALGASGVWMGSVWLTTTESDVPEEVRQMLIRASSTDAVISKSHTGKAVRLLNTPWIEAWESSQAPAALPSPTQALLVRDAMAGMVENNMHSLLGSPVGQIVGMVGASRSVRDVVYHIVDEFVDSVQRLETLVNE